MNIFVLDTDVIRCAEYHNDKHVVKLAVETTQLLNNALIANNKDYIPIYKQTHKNHPASIWAQTSQDNFSWLTNLGLALCREYSFRYGKIHKCQSIIEGFSVSSFKLHIPIIELTPFIKCMPDQYKVNDPVISYRNYYQAEKAHIAKWTKRSTPDWWQERKTISITISTRLMAYNS